MSLPRMAFRVAAAAAVMAYAALLGTAPASASPTGATAYTAGPASAAPAAAAKTAAPASTAAKSTAPKSTAPKSTAKSTAPASAASGSGWVRLAHLSPNAPAVDVYLYSFGSARARLVLRHVSYGMVSPYQEVPAGDYTVSMRSAGAAPTAQPLLSTGFGVDAGESYTVAGMGPAAGLRLQVLNDTLTVPAGRVLIRVIQASLREHVVSVRLGGLTLARRLDFARTTPYQAVAPGSAVAQVTGTTETASLDLSLRPDSIHTLVVLDGAGRLRLTDLEDAAGSAIRPEGGAATGMGGTAPRPASSPVPWLALIGTGVLLASAAARRYRRIRTP